MSIRRRKGAEPATSRALAEPPNGRTPSMGERRAWRLDGFSIIASVFAIIGMLTLLYPNIASWITQYEQSRIVSEYGLRVAAAGSEKEAQLQRAREYNEGLRVGAVLEENVSIPKAEGESEGTGGDYHSILSLDDSGLMGLVRIPSIELDLPIYHGTDVFGRLGFLQIVVVKRLLRAEWQTASRLPGKITVCAVNNTSLHIVAQGITDDCGKLPFNIGIINRSHHLHAAVKVARHPVGRPDKHFVFSRCTKLEDTGMFKIAVNDTYNMH